jgi:sugar phosphate isomerase/epimerase
MAIGGMGAMLLPVLFPPYKSMASTLSPGKNGTKTTENGVVLGIQTYSFRDLDLDEAIKAMVTLGVKSCELWEGHVEPRELQWAAGQSQEEADLKKEKLKKWRNELDMDHIKAIRAKFDAAGIAIFAYTGTMKDAITEHDMELLFRIAKALGTDLITTSATVSVMKRIDVYARKYKIKVGMHNHSHVDKPNEFSSPESFAKGMQGLSDYICINLDIGHFTAANFDAVAYIKQHHAKIVCLHIKDRKKNQGPNVPLGTGDTPIGEVLRLIRDNGYPIPADIEYEYKGTDAVVEVKKCLDYCKNQLKS